MTAAPSRESIAISGVTETMPHIHRVVVVPALTLVDAIISDDDSTHNDENITNKKHMF